MVPGTTIQAIPVAPGIAIGRVMRFGAAMQDIPDPSPVKPSETAAEWERFLNAVEKTKQQLASLQQKLREKLDTGEAAIFDAHLLLVEDQTLTAAVRTSIMEENSNAAHAVYQAMEKFVAAFSGVADEYLRERALDIRDVAMRLIANLSETAAVNTTYDDPRILIASNLTPSETAGLDRQKILGFAVETGSATSHTAILARSLKLPAVVGVPREILDKLTAADKLIVDGYSGKVLVNPDQMTERAYLLKSREENEFYSELQAEANLPSETLDGFRVQLAGNLDADQNYDEIIAAGAAGVGLFRTEFLFVDPDHLPGEEEQFAIYKKLLVSAGNQPVTIRTIDIGGDKLNSGIIRATEQNPFLGLRGIRLCLCERRDIFDTQLRALLRAGIYGDLRVMLPMVSSTTELMETREIIAKLKQELADEQIPCADNLPLGIMIETPVAALIAEKFSPYADFFSIGTNDLIQYTMAVDRSNERVAHLYRPSHPAILKLIQHTVKAALEHNIYVSVCGQMAESIMMLPLLVGLGVHELSMPVASVPVQRRTVRHLERCECEELVAEALKCSNAAEVIELVKAVLERRAPEMMEH